VLGITNRAKRDWNFLSSTWQKRLISKFKEHLQLLCTVDELCVSGFVSSDEMGDGVGDINPVFN
jgi:hypothetical protein